MADSNALEGLIEALRRLPGVGVKSAQRMAFHLLQHDRDGARTAGAWRWQHACDAVHHCERCHTFTEAQLCAHLPRRRGATRRALCVVETPADQAALERTGGYRGLYFVLMGKLSPLDGIGPRDIGLGKLFERGRRTACVEEVILATNFTAEGEATAHVISEGCARAACASRGWRAACRWAANSSTSTWARSPMRWSTGAERPARDHGVICMVFSLAHWCVLVASLLPIVCAGIAKCGRFGKRRSDGGYDNADPRAWLARQTRLACTGQCGTGQQLRSLAVLHRRRGHRPAAGRRSGAAWTCLQRSSCCCASSTSGCTWPAWPACAPWCGRWRWPSTSRSCSLAWPEPCRVAPAPVWFPLRSIPAREVPDAASAAPLLGLAQTDRIDRDVGVSNRRMVRRSFLLGAACSALGASLVGAQSSAAAGEEPAGRRGRRARRRCNTCR